MMRQDDHKDDNKDDTENEARPERIINSDFSRGEGAFGLFWLSLGALLSVLIEVIYLGVRIPLPGGGSVAFPFTIVIAFFFTMVLTKTALLWTKNKSIAAIPLIAWSGGFFLLIFWTGVAGDQLVGASLRSMVLLVAGIAGGSWPLVQGR